MTKNEPTVGEVNGRRSWAEEFSVGWEDLAQVGWQHAKQATLRWQLAV